MQAAQRGNHVVARIKGEKQNGESFIRSSADPVEFTIGEGRMIQGLEEAVIGMRPGDRKRVTLAPDQAFGPRLRDMTIEVERNRIPGSVPARAGTELEMKKPGGAARRVEIVDVSGDTVTIDVNHPLAGQKLTLDIELLNVD